MGPSGSLVAVASGWCGRSLRVRVVLGLSRVVYTDGHCRTLSRGRSRLLDLPGFLDPRRDPIVLSGCPTRAQTWSEPHPSGSEPPPV